MKLYIQPSSKRGRPRKDYSKNGVTVTKSGEVYTKDGTLLLRKK